MKSNKLITSALMALGLISSAHASGTFGTTNVVYITGSTAFRPNLFAAITQNAAGATVFDVGTTVTTTVAGGGAANNGSSTYNAEGVIGGQPYIISVALTGSEAGMAALEGSPAAGISYQVPANAELAVNGGAPNQPNVTLPGTPKPTFLDPQTLTAIDVVKPDLSLADTSQAVSLSASLATLTDYGIVGVIPFTWAKGVNTIPDGSWSDLLNVTQPQLGNFLSTANKANVLTGNAADTDKVYLIGRNEGSGTRVNTLCDLFATIANPISQYAVNNSFYGSGGNVLTAGAVVALANNTTLKNTTAVHLIPVGNDGFDSGSGVKATLNCDIHGVGLVTIGYLGLSDAGGLTHATLATAGGTGQLLTLDGVAESDAAVINGEYSFWGHEHFLGVPSPSAAATVVANQLIGTDYTLNGPNEQLSGFASNGAIEANGNLSTGGGALGNSTCIDPALMHADKPTGGDTGYPSPF
jgi:hypothetical protein